LSRRDPRKYPIILPFGKGPRLKDLGLSLVYTFYNNEEFRLNTQINIWESYSISVKDKLNIVIVDDCARVPIHTLLTRKIDAKVEFYRIKEDLKWNTPGALNLGILNAPTDWVLWLDSDCFLKNDDMENLMENLSPTFGWIYYFTRKRIYKDRTVDYRYHPCASLCHKESFKTTGGFDEDFVGQRSGGYGVFDKDLELRWVKYTSQARGYLQDVPVYEMMPDVTGSSIQIRDMNRVMNDNRSCGYFDRNVKLMYDKNNGIKLRNRKLLNFEWEKHDLR